MRNFGCPTIFLKKWWSGCDSHASLTIITIVTSLTVWEILLARPSVLIIVLVIQLGENLRGSRWKLTSLFRLQNVCLLMVSGKWLSMKTFLRFVESAAVSDMISRFVIVVTSLLPLCHQTLFPRQWWFLRPGRTSWV
ncbi:hypothetical protein LINGRAHAP2_LOCUS28987 [Linum grandiflorum]